MSAAARYVVGERLAVGGMAEVFFGTRKSDGKDVVIKKMLPQLARDPQFVKRFFKEGALASQLKHENIIEIVELVDDGDDVLMVMEAVDGADLATLLKQARRTGARIPLALSLHIVSKIAWALVCADETPDKNGQPLRIVHRDVTPSNILVSRAGQVKLIDFGIARAPLGDNFTRSGFLVGKIHYLAPEQVNHQPIDGRVDVWAAGCVLFQLLTGRRPFDGLSEPAVLVKIGTGERRDVRELAIVPEKVALVVDRALAVDPKDRYKNARAFARALDDAIADAALPATAKELGALVNELVPAQEDETPFEGTLGPARGETRTARSLALDDGKPEPPDPSLADEDSSLFARASRGRSSDEASSIEGVPVGADDDVPEESTLLTATPAPPSRPALQRPGPDEVTRTAQAPRPSLPSLPSRPTGPTPAQASVSTEKLKRPPSKARPPQQQQQKRSVVALVAGAALASFVLGAGFVVVVGGLKDGAAAPPPAPSPSPSPPLVAAVTPPVTPPSPVATPTPTPVTTTTPEPPAPTPTPTPTVAAPKRAVKKAGVGEIVVDSRPWSTVILDGEERGVTPTVLKNVRAGRHTLVLENKEQGLRKTLTVVVEADETATVRENLKR